MSKLHPQHILITGSGEGIGLELLKKILLKNIQIKITCHYHIKTKEFDKIVKKNKEVINVINADFANKKSINKLLNKIKKLDITHIANIAGIHDYSFNKKNRFELINKTYSVNTIVPALIIETIFPYMKKINYGNIINISSIGIKYGSNPESIFYGSSKAGLEAITTTYARIGAKFNVLVNNIRPGITDTDFYKKIKKNLNERVKLIPMQRAAHPEEIADFIYLILFNNTFMTGQTLSIAGGE